MKKQGFTLAEVLITMAIIGIVAAILMPAVITSYQCKTVGVKLSKFASTVENAARAYVVSNDSFTTENNNGKDAITTFINDTFIFKSVAKAVTKSDGVEASRNINLAGKVPTLSDNTRIGFPTTNKQGAVKSGLVGIMKDNTRVYLKSLDETKEGTWDTADSRQAQISTDKVGHPVFTLVFDPYVTGMTKDVQKQFKFVVTELGYMFPAADDKCLWSIYSADYATTGDTFKKGNENACFVSNTTTTP